MIVNRKYERKRKGVALIIILVLVMTITIISLGFISRGDKELLCGQNAELKSQMDYLAHAGLEHARGLILNPQDVQDEYWHGAEKLQLIPGSEDYYDVLVNRTDYCNYQITSTAYRLQSGKKTAKSSLIAELRLDPCIGLSTGNGWSSEPITTVYADVYCKGDLTGYASIYGDAYAKGSITASNITGSRTINVSDYNPPVALPILDADNFSSTYRIGSNVYYVTVYPYGTMNSTTLGPTASNPAGIYFYYGSLNISNNVTINGTLVLKGELRITGRNNTIKAQKNFPAVITNNKLKMSTNSQLSIQGLAYVRDEIYGEGIWGQNLSVVGALIIRDNNINNMSYLNSINIWACADKAALKLWSNAGSYKKWSPAAGAFFKSIERVP
jgi:hypothetical protein